MLFQQLFSDPLGLLESLLITLPGVLLALSGHEAAHAYVANKCGDPTARLMGRITLNPLRHIDPFGFLCMLFIGFGWAKPVPVNPHNLRKGRRDDFFVSIAGITANIIMCLIGFALLTVLVLIALAKAPVFDDVVSLTNAGLNIAMLENDSEKLLIVFLDNVFYKLNIADAFDSVYGMHTILDFSFGWFGRTAFGVLRSFITINIALAAFNLIPIPPLDGYHVLNDLLLKRPLFAPQKAAKIGMGIMFALIMIGNIKPEYDIISIVINFVLTNVLNGLSQMSYFVCNAIGLI